MTATVKDAAGNPTPGITVRFTVTGSVNTSGSDTTDANGEATFCYQGPELPGADAISAFADTDNDTTQDPGEPVAAASKVWTLPVTTPLCQVKVENGGTIIAKNGDKASFGGNAQSNAAGNVKGQQQYQDHGPAQAQKVKSIHILALTCNPQRTQATIFGRATINGQGSHLFRIDVQDLGEPGLGIDTYRILLDTGYDSGSHTLRSGNIQIR
ncbi:Ig-like domain-containing protein [Arthrobacter sp. ISL-5]|uniref:Ig-like domain-containing protein n=1 Tax=Arthrobacter sp. ISL-5 TaxID=2819111 RepID=UPI001BE7DC99|nr:Ig-like domain-containing protein [Arthrobacter sp. ISL-5]MBT2551842.1 Ig-like domain-containing protein [Arthrobacter sp. ISL-5]